MNERTLWEEEILKRCPPETIASIQEGIELDSEGKVKAQFSESLYEQLVKTTILGLFSLGENANQKKLKRRKKTYQFCLVSANSDLRMQIVDIDLKKLKRAWRHWMHFSPETAQTGFWDTSKAPHIHERNPDVALVKLHSLAKAFFALEANRRDKTVSGMSHALLGGMEVAGGKSLKVFENIAGRFGRASGVPPVVVYWMNEEAEGNRDAMFITAGHWGEGHGQLKAVR